MAPVGFISDLHLAEEHSERIALFLRFLDQYATQLDHLYILGDLFEVWLGDDLITPAIHSVIVALKQASNVLSIDIMHGNRDFLMGPNFEKMSGCRIVNEPQVVNLGNQDALIMHGDLLCTDDHQYLKMRKQLRSPGWIKSFLIKSAGERAQTALELQQKSQMAVQNKDSEIMDANSDEVVAFMERHQVALLIHGHTHQTAIHNHRLSTGEMARRYVLDEWHDERGQILISNSRGLHFETIPESI